MNWKPPEFTEAEVRDLLSRKPGQPKIVKYPKRSAWDELVFEHDYKEESEMFEMLEEWVSKYKDELKQIRAKD